MFQQIKRFIRYNPLLSAVVSIVIAVLLIRASFSNILFGNDIKEIRFWIAGFGILICIIGLVSLRYLLTGGVPKEPPKKVIHEGRPGKRR